MIKAVIFDMDGVIFDSEPIHVKFEQELFKSLGLDISEEEHHTFVGSTTHYMWELVKEKYDLPQTLDELVKNDRDKYFEYLTSGKCDIDIISGVRELIERFHGRGFKLAVASSSPLNVIEAVVDMYDIRKYFDVLVTGDYVEKSKPNPDIFLYTAEKLKAEPENCLVIEDSANGVLAAKRAGMKCIGYKNPNSGNQDLSSADIIVDSHSQIDINLDTRVIY